MIITTTDTTPNKEVSEILGISRESTVRARNIGRDISWWDKKIILLKFYLKPSLLYTPPHIHYTHEKKL